MNKDHAVVALSPLAQASRLDVFRLLVQAGTEGLDAGAEVGTPWPTGATLSFHLKELRHAGLVTFRREGRSLIYAAPYEIMNDLLAYLVENCCQGDAAGRGPGACDRDGQCQKGNTILTLLVIPAIYAIIKGWRLPGRAAATTVGGEQARLATE